MITNKQRDCVNNFKITKEYIESRINNVSYHCVTDTKTLCIITLDNGFTVTGESDVAYKRDYNLEIGQKVSFEKALNKVWDFIAFMVKQYKFDMAAEIEYDKVTTSGIGKYLFKMITCPVTNKHILVFENVDDIQKVLDEDVNTL